MYQERSGALPLVPEVIMSRSLLALPLLVAVLLGPAGAAGAAVPANDDCAAATEIPSVPFRLTEALAPLATRAATDPAPSCTGGQAHQTMWFRFTPALTQRVVASTRTS